MTVLFSRRALVTVAVIGATAISGFFLQGLVPSQAVQDPAVSLDMVPAGNSYDEATNTMTVGASEDCLTSATANANTHAHAAQLVIRNVEDLVGWQTRFNYIGDKMRISTVNFTPFTDNLTGQSISFTNLPIDATSGLHRTITSAGGVGPAAPPDGSNTSQTHLAGATYDGVQNFAVSPDTPAKAAPDDVSYDAPAGGVLATVSLQVVGNESGQSSLFMNLDDGSPNPPSSRTVVFTDSGSVDINLASTSLGDGYHGEGVTCTPQDCVTTDCPLPVDIRNHTFTNNTPLPASSLHIRFSSGITPTLVQNAPGCPAPTISGDHSAGRLDVEWGALCVENGENVIFEIRSWPIAVPTCSHWSILGNATLEDCDRPLP